MQPTEKQLDIFTKLSELEESIGRFYEVLAETFPTYKNFWSGLADEEKQHSAWVNKLRILVVQGTARFAERDFNSIAIRTFINYIESEMNKAKRNELSTINALSTTLYIEQSLIENKYFETFTADSQEVKQILDDLAVATRLHISKVQDVFNNFKRLSH